MPGSLSCNRNEGRTKESACTRSSAPLLGIEARSATSASVCNEKDKSSISLRLPCSRPGISCNEASESNCLAIMYQTLSFGIYEPRSFAYRSTLFCFNSPTRNVVPMPIDAQRRSASLSSLLACACLISTEQPCSVPSKE